MVSNSTKGRDQQSGNDRGGDSVAYHVIRVGVLGGALLALRRDCACECDPYADPSRLRASKLLPIACIPLSLLLARPSFPGLPLTLDACELALVRALLARALCARARVALLACLPPLPWPVEPKLLIRNYGLAIPTDQL